MKVRRKVQLTTPKAGQHLVAKKYDRNGPCPCGSGKKNKICCKIYVKYYSSGSTSV